MMLKSSINRLTQTLLYKKGSLEKLKIKNNFSNKARITT